MSRTNGPQGSGDWRCAAHRYRGWVQEAERQRLYASGVGSWYVCISHPLWEPGEVLPTLDGGSQIRQLMLRWRVAGQEWQTLTFYQRFRSAVALGMLSEKYI
jgi:hypothetical protein